MPISLIKSIYQLFIYNLQTVHSTQAALYVFKSITCFINDDLELAKCVYLISLKIGALQFSQLTLTSSN